MAWCLHHALYTHKGHPELVKIQTSCNPDPSKTLPLLSQELKAEAALAPLMQWEIGTYHGRMVATKQDARGHSHNKTAAQHAMCVAQPIECYPSTHPLHSKTPITRHPNSNPKLSRNHCQSLRKQRPQSTPASVSSQHIPDVGCPTGTARCNQNQHPTLTFGASQQHDTMRSRCAPR